MTFGLKSPLPTYTNTNTNTYSCSCSCLRVVEQRLPLPISRFGVRHAAEQAVATGVRGSRDVQRDGSEDAKDGESKDPLKGDDLNCDLPESQCCNSVSQILVLKCRATQETYKE